jgi:hypothetical protein
MVIDTKMSSLLSGKKKFVSRNKEKFQGILVKKCENENGTRELLIRLKQTDKLFHSPH